MFREGFTVKALVREPMKMIWWLASIGMFVLSCLNPKWPKHINRWSLSRGWYWSRTSKRVPLDQIIDKLDR